MNAVQTQVATKTEIIKIIPNGTAIQNTRSSFVGDSLTRDNYDHLTYDLGRYIAALTFVTTIAEVDLTTIDYAPTGLTTAYINVAKESVENAIKTPYAVTHSAYTELSEALIGNKTQTAVTFTQGFYNSTVSDTITYDTVNGDKFFATQKFTKETLPVGSLLYIASGWQYRPEGWIDGNKNSSRPDNVSTQWIEVTEEWWGNYTERAFNVSTNPTSDISGKTQSEMKEIFKIYIPSP